MKIRNHFGNEYSGTLAKDLVASSWKGHDYVRKYVVPRDPKTESQMQRRADFRAAVEAWHALSDDERKAYDREAKGMTGFNLFVSRYVRAKRREATAPPPPSV